MIPIGQVGRIRAGELPGWFVIVKDDREVTGGLYVVVSSHLDFHGTPHGTDFWVESADDLDQFFEGSGWNVD
jgi:hypothetical protein